MRSMTDAPKDGTRVLLKYTTFGYRNGAWRPGGPKWEECRWMSDQASTGSPPHWEPWCGGPRTRSTDHIKDSDCFGWLPVTE